MSEVVLYCMMKMREMGPNRVISIRKSGVELCIVWGVSSRWVELRGKWYL